MTKTMLVTGGSRGIGAAVCRRAATAGYDVAINFAGRADAAEAVAVDVRAAGRRALVVKADVTEPAERTALFERTVTELDGLDVFVNNAGIIHEAAPLAELDEDVIRRVLDVDLTAALLAAREAVRRMSPARGGRGGVIVTTSSIAARLAGLGGFLPYAMAKAAVDVMTEGLGREVAGQGIRVCQVRPGLIATDIHDDTGETRRLEKLAPSVPLGRVGTADEVAAAILWLCSDDASYVAGASLDVSGGR
ncbi:MAG: SDR family oxidoreductase [Pseudomonadota bacterium]